MNPIIMTINHNTYIKTIILVLLVLVFFPSITFSLLHAEVFPWALIVFFVLKLKINKVTVLYISWLLLSVIIGFAKHNSLDVLEIIRSFAAFLNPLLIFLFLCYSSNKYIFLEKKLIFYIFSGLFILGLFQYSGSINFLEPVFKILVPRGSVDMTEGGRGVRLLSSEPSRAAVEFMFIYALFRLAYLRGFKLAYIFDVLIILFILFVLKSGMGALFAVLFFTIIYPMTSLSSLILVITSIPTLINFDLDSRALSIIINVVSSLSFDTFFDLMMKNSGFRLPSILSVYTHIPDNLLGYGLGNWKMASLITLNDLGIPASEINYFKYNFNSQFVSVRPTSYVAALMLDTGIIGALLLALILKKHFIFGLKNKVLYPMLSIFILYMFIFGSIGNPVPWICFAISLRLCWFESTLTDPKNIKIC
jgi:hypothetical protein